jgi:TRAP-type C4-dicarboxylate transport system permease large subunit
LPLVIYGVIADTSIGQLFAAGLIPGLMMALALMLMVAWKARIKNYPRDERFRLKHFWASLVDAAMPLMTPVIIVGGIITGVFTPTEAAIAAVAYSAILGLVVYWALCHRDRTLFLIPLIAVLLLMNFVPFISMWLPTLIYR